MRKVVISNVVLIIAFALVGYWYYSMSAGIGPDKAGKKAEQFITDKLVKPGTEVKVKGVSEVSDMYKVEITVGKQELTTYLSKDGSTFFPEGMVIDEMNKQTPDAKAQDEQKPVAKSDKPVVEMFVMSYCPYGTQIEKGMLPVVEALGNKIDFRLKFVSYAMHEKKEIDENLRQYCIQKEEPTKLSPYLKCFLQSEKSDECLKTNGVSASKLASCVSAADKEFGITTGYNDKSAWKGNFPPFGVDKADNEKYSVQGSPTLVINGTTVPAQRDPASLMKSVCSAFNTEPEECQKEMSSETPAPGFGDGTAATSSPSAGCAN